MPDGLGPGLQSGVARGDTADREQRPGLVVAGEGAIGVGHQDPAAVVGVAGADLGDGVGRGAGDLLGPAQQPDLGRLVDLGRPDPDRGTTGGVGIEVDRSGLPRCAAPGRVGGGPGGREQAPFGQVGGVGETGRLARDHADAGATITTGAEALDAAVVEVHRAPLGVLGEHLREVRAPAEGRFQRPSDDIGVDQGDLGPARRLTQRLAATAHRDRIPSLRPLVRTERRWNQVGRDGTWTPTHGYPDQSA